jgi:hypothetical protein
MGLGNLLLRRAQYTGWVQQISYFKVNAGSEWTWNKSLAGYLFREPHACRCGWNALFHWPVSIAKMEGPSTPSNLLASLLSSPKSLTLQEVELKWKGMYNIDDGRVWGFDDFDIYATDARS